MADAVTSTIVEDGPNKATFYLTNTSDGTGEAAVTKIDVSALAKLQDGTSCTGVRIQKITFTNVGMSVKLLWDASTDVLCLHLPADYADTLDFGDGGLKNNSGSGKTGDIMLTTVGHSSGDAYTVTLTMTKNYA